MTGNTDYPRKDAVINGIDKVREIIKKNRERKLNNKKKIE